MTGLPEEILQQQVVTHFLDMEARHGGFYFFHIPNGQNTSKRAGGRMKSMGLRSGVADLAFLLPGGKSVFVELKALSGSMSKEQKSFMATCGNLGFPFYCVKGRTGGRGYFDDFRGSGGAWVGFEGGDHEWVEGEVLQGRKIMTIDVLTYELKYKNDEMVMELLREYRASITAFSELEDEVTDYDDFSGKYEELKEAVTDAKTEIEDVLAYIGKLKCEGEEYKEEVTEQLDDLRAAIRGLPS